MGGINNANNYQITQYDLLVGGSNNTISNISPSTSTYVCQSNGSSANPSFVAPTSITGAWVKLQTQTASSSSTITFTSTYLTTTYTAYVLVFENVVFSGASSNLNMVLSTNNGSSYLSSGYASGNMYIAYNGTTYSNQNTTSAYQIYTGGGSSTAASGTLYMYNFANSNANMIFGSTMVAYNYLEHTFGAQTTTGVNNLQLSTTTGTLSTGTFTLYGIQQ